jgi:hypothetical protein
MQLTDEQKDLVREHRLLIAKFNGDNEQAARLQEIETILDKSTEELAELAIDDYMKQY